MPRVMEIKKNAKALLFRLNYNVPGFSNLKYCQLAYHVCFPVVGGAEAQEEGNHNHTEPIHKFNLSEN